MTTKPFKFCAALALAAVLGAVAGCTDKSSPDNIDRRSVERWNYLIARQGEKAYDYLTPGFRQTKTREDYAASMNNRPVRWKVAKFNRKECEADNCKVFVDVTYSVTLPGATTVPAEVTTTQNETWILTDGDWYFLPK